MLLIAFALIFYRVGSTDYGRGWPCALLSILASLAGAATDLSFIGVVGANILLFFALLVYNLISKRPSTERSGSSAPRIVVVVLIAVGCAWWFYRNRSDGTTEPASAAIPQFATAAEAQREAVRRHPDLGIVGSKLNGEFLARYKLYQQQRPEYFRDQSWPLRLADELTQTPQSK